MLYLIDPLPIGDGDLFFTNIPENDYPAWNAGTSYVRGDRVIVLATHKVYQAAAATVQPALPPQSDLFNAETRPTGKWVEVGATRRWKPFDGRISDQASFEKSNTIQWRLRLGRRADSIALFGLGASRVNIRVIQADTGTIVYEVEQSAIDLANITDGWDFFNNNPAFHTEMVFRGLPISDDTHVRIEVINDSGIARVGEIVIGQEVEIGQILVGGGASFQDFSRKTTDDFGHTSILRRATADIATYPALVAAHRERYILRTLQRLRATPAVFHAGQEMTSRGLTVFGFFRDVPVTLSSPTHSQLNIEVEGLT